MSRRVPLAVALGAALLSGWLGAVAGRSAHRHPVGAVAADTGQHVILDRPDGTPLVFAPVRDGNLLLRPLSEECGLPAVFGTHAEAEPEGQFCRVWAEVVNPGTADHELDTRLQALTDRAGVRFAPDPSAMAIRRQAPTVRVGGHQRMWLELWFDVPRAAAIGDVRLTGDADPPGYQAISPAPRAPGGVRFPFPPMPESRRG